MMNLRASWPQPSHSHVVFVTKLDAMVGGGYTSVSPTSAGNYRSNLQ